MRVSPASTPPTVPNPTAPGKRRQRRRVRSPRHPAGYTRSHDNHPGPGPWAPSPGGPPVAPGAALRPTVRALLLDPADRLLLFASLDEAGERFWYPAGGAVEAGETAVTALLRELAEETGLTPATGLLLGPEVWRRRHVVGWSGVLYDLRERWFLARAGAAVRLDVRGWTSVERSTVAGTRWWTPAELAAAGERLTPSDLAARLARLLAEGPPPVPLEVGV